MMSADIARVKKRGRPRKHTRLQVRLIKLLANINGRCGAWPTVNNAKYYAGRGIRNFLTLSDLEFLWVRDDAGKMAQPSIDRRESDQDYTLENCRFIEFADNRKGANRRVSYAVFLSALPANTKTIRQAAIALGISVQAVHDRIKATGIEPKRDKVTNWRMLTDAQIKRLDGKKVKR